MTNTIHLENFCEINGKMIATNGKIIDIASSAKTKTVVSYKGAVPQHDAFYDNTAGVVGMVQVPVIMTPEIKNRCLTEFSNDGKIFAILNIKTNNYSGTGILNGLPNLENGSEVTLEFTKLNPNNQ